MSTEMRSMMTMVIIIMFVDSDDVVDRRVRMVT